MTHTHTHTYLTVSQPLTTIKDMWHEETDEKNKKKKTGQ